MRRLVLVVALLTLPLFAACSSRERTNPLDPGNPETGGRPAGFVARAGNSRVELRWNVISVPDLVGYRLERRGPTDTIFVEVAGSPLPPDEYAYDDLFLLNDSTYAYRLSFVLADGTASAPSTAQARPGPGALWIADAGSDRVLKLTADGALVAFTLAAPDQPGWLRVDPASGSAWASSRTLGVVAVWSASGTLTGASSEFGSPGAVAPIPGTSSGWIGQERFGEVSRWNPTSGVTDRNANLGLPSDVVVTPDRGAWIADRSRSQLIRIADDGTALRTVPLSGRPWRLAFDPVNDELWVVYTEEGAVERRAASDGSLAVRIGGLDRPYGIAVDVARGVAWVAIAGGDAVAGFDRSGATRIRLAVEDPRSVAVDGRLGEVWVGAFGGGGEIRRYGPGGDLRSVVGGVDLPYAIDFDPGRGF